MEDPSGTAAIVNTLSTRGQAQYKYFTLDTHEKKNSPVRSYHLDLLDVKARAHSCWNKPTGGGAGPRPQAALPPAPELASFLFGRVPTGQWWLGSLLSGTLT